MQLLTCSFKLPKVQSPPHVYIWWGKKKKNHCPQCSKLNCWLALSSYLTAAHHWMEFKPIPADRRRTTLLGREKKMKCLKIFTMMVLRTASQRTQRRCEEGAEGACASPMFPRVQLSIRCKAQCGISFCALVSADTQGCGWSPSAPSCAEQSRLTCERDTSKAAQHLEMKCRRSARRSRCSKALRWLFAQLVKVN